MIDAFCTYQKQNGEIIIIIDHTVDEKFNKTGYVIMNCHTGQCQDVTKADMQRYIDEKKIIFKAKCDRR